MDSRYWRDNNYGSSGGYSNYRPGMIQSYDYANWGYIILYIIVIILSLLGNFIFLMTVKRNSILQKTPHFLLCTLAVRDLIVTLGVIPFVIDSQAVNFMHWKAGEGLCKAYSFLNYGTMGTHSFNIVFLLFFLYFWYRKQESYANPDGNIIRRETKMHKWAIPLMWVIGISLAIPAGALAWLNMNPTNGSRNCVLWPGYGSGNNYWANLGVVLGGFLIPLIFVAFPSIALLMQAFNCREPRLDPPHSRTAITGVALFLTWLITRCPYEIHQMVGLFNQGRIGNRVDPQWSAHESMINFEKEMIFNALIFIAPAIHPILYYTINPLYRECLKKTWKTFLCGKSGTEDPQGNSNKEQMKEMKQIHPSRNRAPPVMRYKEEPLVDRRGPVIVPAASGGAGFYNNSSRHHPHSYQPPPQHQPLAMHAPHFEGNLSFEEQQTMRAIAEHHNHFPLDNSFENHSLLTNNTTTSPNANLPPVFEFEGLKYIDTARVEPRIAYSPEKTPPKTPDTPRYEQKPFADPVERFLQNNAMMQSQMQEMVDFPLPTPLPESPMLMRAPSRVDDLDETLEVLDESPGSKKRNRNNRTKEGPIQINGSSSRNSIHQHHDSEDVPRSSGIEIKICGRSRSRTDLCPDVPRSKFEHCV